MKKTREEVRKNTAKMMERQKNIRSREVITRANIIENICYILKELKSVEHNINSINVKFNSFDRRINLIERKVK